jgi:hypothetical protein
MLILKPCVNNKNIEQGDAYSTRRSNGGTRKGQWHAGVVSADNYAPSEGALLASQAAFRNAKLLSVIRGPYL